MQSLLALVLIALCVLVLNPFHFWMPTLLAMMLLIFTFAAFAAFAAFVIRERAEDERAILHRMYSGRFAFLAGSFVLTLGILFQALHHHVDAWLVGALAVMVFAKLLSRLYGDRYQ